jgi:hypothetical protein
MRTEIILIGLFAMAISGCVPQKYLPSVNDIDINQHGSYIQIRSKTKLVSGELIAVDSMNLVILSKLEKKCVSVPVKDINSFTLYYAKAKNYGWTIPLFTIPTPYIHGSYAMITAPAGLLISIVTTASGQSDFTYNNKKISYEGLKMFARFPQGIPPCIDLASIE